MEFFSESKKDFSLDLFKNPTSEYRSAPFWAWNDLLEKDELCFQIDKFKEMGFGGFNMHPRQGLVTEYLSPRFMKMIKTCVKKAKKEGLSPWLYDEDRFPSGFAGGIVTKNPEYRIKQLVFTKEKDEDVFNNKRYSSFAEGIRGEKPLLAKTGYKQGKRYLLGVYSVEFSDNFMEKYLPVSVYQAESGKMKGDIYYAYVEIFPCLPGWNGVNIADLMMEEAVDKFIDCTYEKYFKAVGKEFGKAIPAIFTDEPQVSQKRSLKTPFSGSAYFSWTNDFPLTFKEKFGYDILEKLPELVFDTKLPSETRLDYFNHQADRLNDAYVKKLAKWCRAHDIAFSGHFAQEDELKSQSRSLGEAMRLYTDMDVAGIDLLANRTNFNTAKQAQSVVHQTGKTAFLSELYGVTGWNFDFNGYKFQGDWQAALGVNVRVPHLAWYSMRGMGKRDYPACIGYQSSWYKENKYLEDYFARVNVALTRGNPIVNIGVIHPLESFQLSYGTDLTSGEIRTKLERDFTCLSETLLFNGLDFDYISESLIPNMAEIDNEGFIMGKMKYGAIVVPPVLTLRESTVNALYEFIKSGGKVIFTGDTPLMDAKESEKIKEVYNLAIKTPFTESEFISGLESEREIKIKSTLDFGFIYQMRKEKDAKWLFIANGKYDKNQNPSLCSEIEIKIKGEFSPELFDALSGETYSVSATTENGFTTIKTKVYPYESLLYRLTDEKSDSIAQKETVVAERKEIAIPKDFEFGLSENNVCVLDQPKYSFDGKTFNENEEMLRINEILRAKFNYPPEKDGISQPYATDGLKVKTHVYLKFEIESKVEADVLLAFERLDGLTLNGKKVKIKPNGYFTDRHILTAPIGTLIKGVNTVIAKVPFGQNVSLENMFILGNFACFVKGRKITLSEMPKKITLGDITKQGLSFYGGVITYRVPIELPISQTFEVDVSGFNGICVTATVGNEKKNLSLAPQKATFDLQKGKHTVEINLFASRNNCFGTLHNVFDPEYMGADAFATTGDDWQYEYNIKPNGLNKLSINLIRRQK